MDELKGKFIRESDGSWTCVEPADLQGPTGRIQVTPGAKFTRGTVFMGVELAQWLEQQHHDLGR